MTGDSRKLALAAGLTSKSGSARGDALIGQAAGGDPRECIDKDTGEQLGAYRTEASRLAAIAQSEYAARRRRDILFNADIFAEPAWDILLDLYTHRHQGRDVSVHSLCIAAAVPQTTALRWIGKLAMRALINRTPSLQDHRVVHVSLTETGITLMESYLRGQLGEREAGPGPPLSFS